MRLLWHLRPQDDMGDIHPTLRRTLRLIGTRPLTRLGMTTITGPLTAQLGTLQGVSVFIHLSRVASKARAFSQTADASLTTTYS